MFPFLRGQQYSIGELRTFEKELLSKRQTDQVFSSDLRVNDQLWAKLWNEELVPFELLVNWLNVPDEFKFEISSKDYPGPDITLILPIDSIGIQVTIADPDWKGNGGRTQALENSALKRDGIAWGAGGTSKHGAKGLLVSEPRSVDSVERQNACRDGIVKALNRKLDKPRSADCLLIYARSYWWELIDVGFEKFLRPIVMNAVSKFNRDGKLYPVFVVDTAGSGRTAFSVKAEQLMSVITNRAS